MQTYQNLDVIQYAQEFHAWFQRVLAKSEGDDLPDPNKILGVNSMEFPDGFRPLASALTFTVRPTGDTSPVEACEHAQLLVAGALACWLFRDTLDGLSVKRVEGSV